MSTGISSRRNSSKKNLAKYDISEKEKIKIKKQVNELRKNAKTANKLLKVKSVGFYDFPDNEMDSVSLLKIVKTIESEIEEFNPNIIYTNHRSDLNVDHQTTFRATITASRPGTNNVKEILSFEVPSSTEWNYPYSFSPNLFIDITKELPNKIKAMSCFESEFKKFPHPRSKKSLESIAFRWGSVSGFNAAEAFEIIRKINF